jgi:multidrug efflux pump subunit AcrA (membrane-fusion protein)
MTSVDLGALRIDESSRQPTPRPRGPRGARAFGIAVLVLLAAAGATFVWPLLAPVRAVRTAAIRLVAEDPESAGPAAPPPTGGRTAVAEAVGWVEPDPFPTIVRPLVTGHIETLEVLEGAAVRAGETVIARLQSAGLQAATERATARLAEAEAAAARARADRDAAAARLAQNAEARLRLRDAELRAESMQTLAATAREEVERSKAAADAARAHATGQESLAAAGSVYPVALERARAEARAADASVVRAEQQLAGAERELAAARTLVALSKELASDPVTLRTDVVTAEAAVTQADAALLTARTELAIAEREFGWATVLAPVDGIVLRLEAQPGDQVGHDTKGIVALYDPQRLRARIDVPFDSVAGIHEGQAVEIRSDTIGDRVVRGVVQRLQHESDLLKNTLQVKVGLIDPPALLRPETLCRARFLAGDGRAVGAGGDPAARPNASSGDVATCVVPASSVQGDSVFVLDPGSGTARAVAVEVLGSDGNDRIVRGPLSPTQRVVTEPVRAGERIREIER